jgi:hypothetical protein
VYWRAVITLHVTPKELAPLGEAYGIETATELRYFSELLGNLGYLIIHIAILTDLYKSIYV